MESALYHPYIKTPQSPWFNSVLLYWDEAATIVPATKYWEPERLDPYMNKLRSAGLLKPINVDNYYQLIGSDVFIQRFLELLAAYEATDRPQLSEWAEMHSAKGDVVIFDKLRERGLATMLRGPEWETWWRVEAGIADLYMAYLAGALCGCTPGMHPVTDSTREILKLARPKVTDVSDRLAELRFDTFVRLPIPQATTLEVEKLQRFKADNRENLVRLRSYLDAKLIDVAQIDNEVLRETKKEEVMREIRQDIAIVQERMRSFWPALIFVGIGGVVGAALTLAATIATGAAP